MAKYRRVYMKHKDTEIDLPASVAMTAVRYAFIIGLLLAAAQLISAVRWW